MKRILFSTFFVAAVVAAWCTSAFAAAETITRTGGGGNPYSSEATGQAAGYFMADVGASYTLKLTNGFPNIFTNNSAGPYISAAVDTDTASFANLLFDTGDNANVYGTIGASNQFLDITLTGSASVNFDGTVNTTTMHVGTGTADFSSGTTNVVSGGSTFTGAAGTGTIDLEANTAFTGAITTTTSGAGTLVLNNNTTVTGAVGGTEIGAITLPGTLVDTTSPTIIGAVNAFTYNLGVNRLNVHGALTTGAGGNINTSLASTAIYGNIAATGASTLGTAFVVNVTPLQLVDIPAGTTFSLVTAPSGNAPAGTVTSSGGFTFTVATLAGQLTITSTADIPAVIPPVAAAVAPAVLTITNPSPGFATVQNSILALSTQAAASALEQLSPLTPALVAPKVTFEGARESQNLWLSRLDMCDQFSSFYKDDPSCQENNPQSGWWTKGFGYFGHRNDRGAFPGYDSVIAGGMIAYDVPLNADTRAGLGLGYTRSIINGKEFRDQTTFDSYRPTVYIGHEQGPWYVDGSASFGWNQYVGTRDISFPGVARRANAKYAGQDYTAYINTGYHIAAPAKFIVTPLVSLQYSRVNMNGYTETGAGDIDLHVKPQGYHFLESGLGAKVERPFSFHKWTIIPDLHVKWFHDFINPTMKQTAVFTTQGASAFTTPGLRTSRETYDVGTGLTLLSCKCTKKYDWSIAADYDYFWRSDGYSANQATLRFTLNF